MPDISDNTNWFETDASNNKASPNGWPEGMMPSGVNDAARANMGALKRFWNRINPLQAITPSGGVWTFTTGNTTYPTAYIDGEVFTFRPAADGAAGDQFQVNALAAKPIWKKAYGGTGWTIVVAGDIATRQPAHVVYDSSLNSGAGAFVLTDPFIPAQNAGGGSIAVAGGISVSGGGTAISAPNGNIFAGGTITSGGQFAGGSLSVSGGIACAGITATGNIVSSNAVQGVNIIAGANFAGPANYTFYGPSFGVAAGISFNASLTAAAGNFQANGSLSVGGGGTAIAAPNGSLVVGGVLQFSGLQLSALAGTPPWVFSGGNGYYTNYAVEATNSGTAFYAPNGNVVCITCSANNFNNTSDAALKTDIADLPDCSDLLTAINPRRYRWREGPDTGTHWGFVFQEVEAAVAASGHDFGGCIPANTDDEQLPAPAGLSYNELLAALWRVTQQLAQRVATLEAK